MEGGLLVLFLGIVVFPFPLLANFFADALDCVQKNFSHFCNKISTNHKPSLHLAFIH